jgi:TPR repeat protein
MTQCAQVRAISCRCHFHAHHFCCVYARMLERQVHQGRMTIPGAAEPINVAVMRVRVGSMAAEAEVLLGLGRHPNLVRFFGICLDGEDELLVTELAPEGSLSALMERLEDEGTVIPPSHKHAMLQQVVNGLGALADAKVIHRDLAARNVLVFVFDPNDVARTLVKVSDFGLAVNGHTATHRYVEGGDRPIRYLPPEALRRGRYSEKSDVWAFGVLAWELLTNGEIPYFEVLEDAIIGRVCGGLRLERPTRDGCGCTDELWRLLTSCWEELPAARPTFAQLAIRLGQQQRPPSPPRDVGVGEGETVSGGNVAAAAAPRTAAVVAPTVAAAATAAAAATRHVAAVVADTAVEVLPPSQPEPPTSVPSDAEYAAGLDALSGRNGVPRDAARARRLFEAAAGRGHARAQGELGRMLVCGFGGGMIDLHEAARVLQLAVDNGDEDAFRDIASVFWNGLGVPKNRDRAAEFCRGQIVRWRARATRADVVAQFCLGWCYANGTGVPQDHHEAVRLYRLAAVQGYVHAQFSLAGHYSFGTGVAQDHSEAVRLLRLAAEQEHAYAQCALGDLFESGTGVTQDHHGAVRLYRLAAEQGHAAAQCALGMCYKNGTGVTRDTVRARRLFEEAAGQSHAPSQRELGRMLVCGFGGGMIDVHEAARVLQLAVDNGDEDACRDLASLFWNGRGVAQDRYRAFELCMGRISGWTARATHSDKVAQFCLGWCYTNGSGIAQDHHEAVRLFSLAAEQGYVHAQLSLAEHCCLGIGVTQDHHEAARLYHIAAEQEYAHAQFMLGRFFENGTGVDLDHQEAIRLYRLAAEQGYAGAQESLQRLSAE